ncbi:hypothetical protein HUB97_01715 [Halorubraceae archaeon YAN]|nr:hypothetical protein [Halorubraceae archaeon YAN]
MDSQTSSATAPLVVGLSLVTIGMLLLDTISWVVQYGVLILGLVLLIAAVIGAQQDRSTQHHTDE